MILFAHRGASLIAPENTLPAFEHAVKNKVQGIELDVHLSKDGTVVVCHDDELSRTSNMTGFLKDKTFSEIRNADAGSWFSEEYKNIKIPTLEEVLEICQKGILINIEIKNIPFFHTSIEQKVIDLVKKFGFEENVIISSFDHLSLKIAQEIDPHISKGLLLSNRLVNLFDYIERSSLKIESLHIPYTFAEEDFIQQAHRNGYKVFPFTVDDKETAEKLKKSGIDGLFTNDIFLDF
jgi:glycerophosphoryl diester phosphodiesterase